MERVTHRNLKVSKGERSPHFGTIRKSVDISEPCSDELEMLLPFELEGLAEEADPDRNPPPRITRGESAVVESGMASRA